MERNRPTAGQALRFLRESNVPINAIVDIGVLSGTPPLMLVFPDKKHYLFEPADTHFPKITHNYRGFDATLIRIALSDEDSEGWIVGVNIYGGNSVTHSSLRDKPVTREEEPQMIECKPVEVARFDSLYPLMGSPKNYLMKIDVDGNEMKVLSGAQESIKSASVVVIEATIGELTERADYIAQQGFKLFDIVDLLYYRETLYQMDLILVRKDIIAENHLLSPSGHFPMKHTDWDSFCRY